MKNKSLKQYLKQVEIMESVILEIMAKRKKVSVFDLIDITLFVVNPVWIKAFAPDKITPEIEKMQNDIEKKIHYEGDRLDVLKSIENLQDDGVLKKKNMIVSKGGNFQSSFTNRQPKLSVSWLIRIAWETQKRLKELEKRYKVKLK